MVTFAPNLPYCPCSPWLPRACHRHGDWAIPAWPAQAADSLKVIVFSVSKPCPPVSTTRPVCCSTCRTVDPNCPTLSSDCRIVGSGPKHIFKNQSTSCVFVSNLFEVSCHLLRARSLHVFVFRCKVLVCYVDATDRVHEYVVTFNDIAFWFQAKYDSLCAAS